jgi:hypothetical protein
MKKNRNAIGRMRREFIGFSVSQDTKHLIHSTIRPQRHKDRAVKKIFYFHAPPLNSTFNRFAI